MIGQMAALLVLSGFVDTPPSQARAAEPLDPRTAPWVCERQRLVGSNIRKTVCIDKRTRDQNRRDAEDILEREQLRALRSAAWRRR